MLRKDNISYPISTKLLGSLCTVSIWFLSISTLKIFDFVYYVPKVIFHARSLTVVLFGQIVQRDLMSKWNSILRVEIESRYIHTEDSPKGNGMASVKPAEWQDMSFMSSLHQMYLFKF